MCYNLWMKYSITTYAALIFAACLSMSCFPASSAGSSGIAVPSTKAIEIEMTGQIINGKKIADELLDSVKREVTELQRDGIQPALAILRVGENADSHLYMRNTKRKCVQVGIQLIVKTLSEDVSEENLLA